MAITRYVSPHLFVAVLIFLLIKTRQHSNRPFPSVPCASVSKRVSLQNLSYENKFGLQEIEPLGGTHFPTTHFDTEGRHYSETVCIH